MDMATEDAILRSRVRFWLVLVTCVLAVGAISVGIAACSTLDKEVVSFGWDKVKEFNDFVNDLLNTANDAIVALAGVSSGTNWLLSIISQYFNSSRLVTASRDVVGTLSELAHPGPALSLALTLNSSLNSSLLNLTASTYSNWSPSNLSASSLSSLPAALSNLTAQVDSLATAITALPTSNPNSSSSVAAVQQQLAAVMSQAGNGSTAGPWQLALRDTSSVLQTIVKLQELQATAVGNSSLVQLTNLSSSSAATANQLYDALVALNTSYNGSLPQLKTGLRLLSFVGAAIKGKSVAAILGEFASQLNDNNDTIFSGFTDSMLNETVSDVLATSPNLLNTTSLANTSLLNDTSLLNSTGIIVTDGLSVVESVVLDTVQFVDNVFLADEEVGEVLNVTLLDMTTLLPGLAASLGGLSPATSALQAALSQLGTDFNASAALTQVNAASAWVQNVSSVCAPLSSAISAYDNATSDELYNNVVNASSACLGAMQGINSTLPPSTASAMSKVAQVAAELTQPLNASTNSTALVQVQSALSSLNSSLANLTWLHDGVAALQMFEEWFNSTLPQAAKVVSITNTIVQTVAKVLKFANETSAIATKYVQDYSGKPLEFQQKITQQVVKLKNKIGGITSTIDAARYYIILSIYIVTMLMMAFTIVAVLVNVPWLVMTAAWIAFIFMMLLFIIALVYCWILVIAQDACTNAEAVIVANLPGALAYVVGFYFWHTTNGNFAAITIEQVLEVGKLLDLGELGAVVGGGIDEVAYWLLPTLRELELRNDTTLPVNNTITVPVYNTTSNTTEFKEMLLSHAMTVQSGIVSSSLQEIGQALKYLLKSVGFEEINQRYINLKNFICCTTPDKLSLAWNLDVAQGWLAWGTVALGVVPLLILVYDKLRFSKSCCKCCSGRDGDMMMEVQLPLTGAAYTNQDFAKDSDAAPEQQFISSPIKDYAHMPDGDSKTAEGSGWVRAGT